MFEIKSRILNLKSYLLENINYTVTIISNTFSKPKAIFKKTKIGKT